MLPREKMFLRFLAVEHCSTKKCIDRKPTVIALAV
jgi:hypothetical protein